MVDDVSTGCVSTTITEPFLAMRKIASYYTRGIMNAAVSASMFRELLNSIEIFVIVKILFKIKFSGSGS
jgi:hypothetical protein